MKGFEKSGFHCMCFLRNQDHLRILSQPKLCFYYLDVLRVPARPCGKDFFVGVNICSFFHDPQK